MGTNTEDYYWALRDLAIIHHVRLGENGSTVPNGKSCAVCKMEWNEGDKERHTDMCLAAPDQME